MKTTGKPRLTVHSADPKTRVEDRGRLLGAKEVAEELFGGKVSQRWVLETLPHNYRHKIGRYMLYYENEVRFWVETTRGAA